MRIRPFAAFAAVPALAVLAAGAGMYDQPYALAQTGRHSEVRKEARVAITKIDGKSTRDTRGSDPIEPGKHMVTLHFTSARGTFRPEFRELEIDFKPCTRYLFNAIYEVPTGPDWKPGVYTEPIGECRRKFMKDQPAQKPAR
ncbi:MAG: hypothetical protein IPP91_12990 [Betaproteobacteria bacterium]|nr:hypothetical protein [Betaproteobacteria bacterium]